jgi:hypothetical protein
MAMMPEKEGTSFWDGINYVLLLIRMFLLYSDFPTIVQACPKPPRRLSITGLWTGGPAHVNEFNRGGRWIPMSRDCPHCLRARGGRGTDAQQYFSRERCLKNSKAGSPLSPTRKRTPSLRFGSAPGFHGRRPISTYWWSERSTINASERQSCDGSGMPALEGSSTIAEVKPAEVQPQSTQPRANW